MKTQEAGWGRPLGGKQRSSLLFFVSQHSFQLLASFALLRPGHLFHLIHRTLSILSHGSEDRDLSMLINWSFLGGTGDPCMLIFFFLNHKQLLQLLERSIL